MKRFSLRIKKRCDIFYINFVEAHKLYKAIPKLCLEGNVKVHPWCKCGEEGDNIITATSDDGRCVKEKKPWKLLGQHISSATFSVFIFLIKMSNFLCTLILTLF